MIDATHWQIPDFYAMISDENSFASSHGYCTHAYEYDDGKCT